ncbi:BTB/POZ domain-containing protein [Thalictrum thalictroides]|uniref:BTB/POZ domain-containing protein n=1 Tax=Thalictrum thalictroides TaxID=46969 RepID=A0A7J6UV49_THATH|nr:BTB/POZ domain-containing protein [Thalictrum thalictroides]
MKFMKLGTKPDTFYTEEAIRSVSSDVPSDLVIQINNTKYLLHKFPLVPKCGLLQRLCAISGDSSEDPIALHDIPGSEEAFELCAKFCYGITINLSANNFVSAFCAAKFLRMTESVDKGNFVQKLHSFFTSCILEGWKDSIITLQTTKKLSEWSESLGITRRCIDSMVEKILTHPSKVDWSYTYTRPGYAEKRHHSVPKDWWTEDIASLDIDMFRIIITAVRSVTMLPPQLIGEALHVYAYQWLPDTSKGRPSESSVSQSEEDTEMKRRMLETIVSMIPPERGSVSVGFLLGLLSTANFLGVSHSTKAELIRRSSWQLQEAKINDLLIPSCSSSEQNFYDIDLVQTVLESFLVQWRRQASPVDSESVRRVAKLIDSYLQVVSRDVNMPALKIVSLAELLPDATRPEHDELYKAINTYLKVNLFKKLNCNYKRTIMGGLNLKTFQLLIVSS